MLWCTDFDLGRSFGKGIMSGPKHGVKKPDTAYSSHDLDDGKQTWSNTGCISRRFEGGLARFRVFSREITSRDFRIVDVAPS